MNRNRSGHARVKRQQGAVVIIVAFILLAMLGMGAFAIDVGRWLVVRNELQNGSDAAALAGAGYLFPPAGGPVVWTAPNWVEATNQGRAAIGLNTSENAALSTGVVTPGWWNFTTRTFDPDTGKVTTANDLPAVRVAITKRTGENAGPVTMLFGRLFGVDSIDASATATAVISIPQTAGQGALMPFAISDCLMRATTGLWDPVNNRPVIPPGSTVPPPFMIASDAAAGTMCGPCNCGQWTSFAFNSQSANVTRQLITGDRPSDPVAIGDPTFIQSGTQAALYGDVQAYLLGSRVGNIAVPIVDENALNAGGSTTPVRGYACLFVYAGIQGGNQNQVCKTFSGQSVIGGLETNKCVIGRFSTEPCTVSGAEGGGGNFTGTIVPPRLVQ